MRDFEYLTEQDIAVSMPLGDSAHIFITRMREPVEAGQEPETDLLVGDILRRTCKLGGAVCAKSGCQALRYYENNARDCSDKNLSSAIEKLLPMEIQPLMVGVTKNDVGFFEEIEEDDDKYQLSSNSEGILEVPGFNAFFVKEKEGVALGARLADCGFLGIELTDNEGEKVIGFMHMTRPNLQGETAFKNVDRDGNPVGSFEFFLQTALDFYQADIDSVKVRMAAAITGPHFSKHFDSLEKLNEHLPGWLEQGLLINVSNPNWQPGDPINPEDEWHPQYREMIEWQIKRAGIEDHQFITEGAVDPGNIESGHASHDAVEKHGMPEARDLYLVSPYI